MSTHSVHFRAHAKINLHLRVLQKRLDGFHELLTWMQPIDWHDDLFISESPASGIDWHCDDSRLTASPDNLVLRATQALATRIGRDPHLTIRLQKNLPLGGGLGGGSSDAAATLLALALLWNINPAGPLLHETAADLGSDIPFFLGDGAAIATDRGTVLTPHPRPFEGFAALIIPPFGIPTPQAYAACRPTPLGPNEQPPWQRPWRTAAELASRLRNDLLPAACLVEPRLAELHHRLSAASNKPVHLSGSGSTLFTLFDDQQSAQNWLTAVQSTTTGAATRVTRIVNAAPCIQIA